MKIFVAQLDQVAEAALTKSLFLARSRCNNFELYADSQCCQGTCIALVDRRRGVYGAIFNPLVEEILLLIFTIKATE